MHAQRTPLPTRICKSPAPLLAASFVLLATTISTFAKKPGSGGGGGGGDPDPGITINPVPDLMTTPPVTYTTTELHSSGDLNENGISDESEATFGGIGVVGVNNQGVAAGTIYWPTSTDPSSDEKRIGVVRLDPTSSSVTPADALFATSLQALNQQRPATEEDWRIAYAGRINDAGLIACRLVPFSTSRRIERNEAIELGIEPTPVLYAVADLTRRYEPDALMLVPISTSPDGDYLDLNELGDVLMFDHDQDTNTYLTRLFPLAENSGGSLGYHIENEIPVPVLTSWPTNRQSFNAARELTFRRIDTSWKLYRYSALVGHEELMFDGIDLSSFFPNGIANDGTAFISATEFVTTGKGRNRQTTVLAYPYHIISPTVRTPLTDPAEDGNASIPHFAWCVPRRGLPGEVEVLIQIEDTLEHQNLQAEPRRPLPDPRRRHRLLADHQPAHRPVGHHPLDPDTGTGTYAAGFISYTIFDGVSAAGSSSSPKRHRPAGFRRGHNTRHEGLSRDREGSFRFW